jgi:CHASE1-domain containing sensor protein
VTNGAGKSGDRSGPDSRWFTGRRLRSAFSAWRASIRGADILVASVFAALALGLGAYALARAQAAVHLAFTEHAQRLEAAVAERLLLPQEDLTSLSTFLESSGQTTRWQFRRLTFSMLQRHWLVYAFEWLPLVRESERSLFEAEARDAGLANYQFWDPGPDGKPVVAGSRPFYLPIHYMEPPSAGALGFDIAANPSRWATAEKARDSGRIAASSPFQLIEDARKPDALPVVALYAPQYKEGDPGVEAARRASLTGFAMTIFRVAPLVDSAATGADAAGLGFALRDLEAPKAPLLAERPKGAAAVPLRADFEIEFQVRFADRRWALKVFPLPGAFLPSRRGAIGVAAAGVLAVLLGLVTATSLRTILRLRRQVEKVGPYRLVARLGHGAMGVVWEARHALLRRPTAIKLLAPGVEGERAVARFEREVQLTAGLTHPSTIAIYDYGRTADGVFYYAMELLRGINLLQLVKLDGPLGPGRVVHLLRQACGALTEAHAAGLIHRDIKPANLMICVYGGIPDFLKVLDFGLVKDVGAVERPRQGDAATGATDATLSQDGSLLGTPLYMAPEGMTSPSDVDARADLFALGAVGYFLLTGHSPFPGRTAIEVFKMEREGPPPPLSSAAPNPVPAPLQDVIGCCLSFDRKDRPASAQELDGMLESCAVAPVWKVEDARAWWQDRGPAALAAARAEREEQGQVLILDSGDRAGSPAQDS